LGIKLIKSSCDKTIDMYLQTFRLQIRVLIRAKCIKDNILSRYLSLSLTDHVKGQRNKCVITSEFHIRLSLTVDIFLEPSIFTILDNFINII